MPIYAKKIQKKWRNAFEKYESLTGFEPLYQDQIDSGEMSVEEAFNLNLKWFKDLYADVMNISTPL